MSIAGRRAEIDALTQAFHSKQAELIVVYGRRRIGKTYLIEQLYGNVDAHFFHVTGIKNAPIKVQLKEFSKQIGKTFLGGIDVACQNHWIDALQELDKAMKAIESSKNIVMFLDELPWMCTPKSGLIQALEYYWNRYWKNNPRVKLVLCGSSASWMIKKIINNTGGLHNRPTLSILLKPFKLNEVQEFLETRHIHLNHQQVAELVMAVGGIPHYLSFVKQGMSAHQAIDALCFQPRGLLYNEFDKLFESLFDDAERYKAIIRAISEKREGASLKAIQEHLKQPPKATSLTRELQDLEDAAFIKSFVPVGHKRRMKFYRLVDEYCYFYLKWIEPAKKSMLTELNHQPYWQLQLHTPEFYSWRGYAFESICYQHLSEIVKAMGVIRLHAVGPWRYTPKKDSKENGAQIDMVLDRIDGMVTLAEMKYTDAPFTWTPTVQQIMQKKAETYKKKTHCNKQINFALISANGLSTPAPQVDYVVTLKDLFAATG